MDRWREKPTDIWTEDGQTDYGQTDRWIDGGMDGQTDGWRNRQMDGGTDGQTDRCMERQNSKRTDGWTNGWTD